jgi:hypothetical protein
MAAKVTDGRLAYTYLDVERVRCWPQLKQLEAGKGPRVPSAGSAEGSGGSAGGSGSGSAAAAHGSGSANGSSAAVHKALLQLLPMALKEHHVMSLRALREFLRDDSRATAAAASAEAPDSELLVRHPPLCEIICGENTKRECVHAQACGVHECVREQ